jgi:membrane protease YdiL (CAAX protease family)
MKKDALAKSLAIFGSLFVWTPLLAPLIFGLISLAADHRFRFDYLMPAEFFPVGFAGGLLLVWAANRSGLQKKLTGWGLVIAVASLVLGQVLAVTTGLASGEMQPEGFWFLLVSATLVIFWLAMILTGIGGVLLANQLFRKVPNSISQDI